MRRAAARRVLLEQLRTALATRQLIIALPRKLGLYSQFVLLQFEKSPSGRSSANQNKGDRRPKMCYRQIPGSSIKGNGLLSK